jgi:hypothetical protein
MHTLHYSNFVIEFVMSLLTILALALGLALDAFSVAIAVGIKLPRLSFRPIFRLSWHFGLFQFLMPILGWLAGVTVQKWVAAFDHWIAFGLLTFIGGKMIYESFGAKGENKTADPTRGWSLVIHRDRGGFDDDSGNEPGTEARNQIRSSYGIRRRGDPDCNRN